MTNDEKIKNTMQTLLKVFEKDNLPVVSQIFFKRDELIPSDKWSFSNRLLMMLNDTTDARGYNQWKHVGRFVKRGSKAFYILGPKIKKFDEYDENGKQKIAIYGVYTIPVFRYEDTDGEPLEYMKNMNIEIPYEFDPIIKELGITIVPTINSFAGAYNIGNHKIELCTPDILTFLHELCHAVDDKLHTLKGGQHSNQEVIAEFGSAVIGYMMGYDVPYGNVKQYIEKYNIKTLMNNLDRVHKVVSYIIEKTEIKEV